MPVPLDFAEIKAWADCAYITLTPFESETLRLMSEHYSVGIINGMDKFALPPYESRTKDEIRRAVGEKFKKLIGST